MGSEGEDVEEEEEEEESDELRETTRRILNTEL